MKKLMIAALMMVGMTAFAQEGKPMRTAEQRDQMTSEQRIQMQLKKLTVELDLNASQQQEIVRLLEERATKREEMQKEMRANGDKNTKPAADRHTERRNEMLEFETAEKAKIKKILTAEQYTKWEAMKAAREEKIKKAAEQKK